MEVGNEGDILGDFYMKFQHAAEDEAVEPLFVSAEHGDGMQDLYSRITNLIPAENYQRYEERREKRLDRFAELKELMMQEIIDFKQA